MDVFQNNLKRSYITNVIDIVNSPQKGENYYMNELIESLKLEEPDAVETAYNQPTERNLKAVPKIKQTGSLVMHVCSHDGMTLKHVAKRLITIKLCETAVEQNGLSLKFVPDRFVTSELCNKAVANNGRALEFVPEIMKTPELSEKAVSYYIDIPLHNATETEEEYNIRCEKHISESKSCGCQLDSAYQYPIAFVPTDFYTKELLTTAIRYSPMCLKNIPYKFLTKELVTLAITLNGLALAYVPPKLCSKSLVSVALENNLMAIRYVPEKYITQEKAEELLKKDYHIFPYLPEKYITQEMCIELIKQRKFAVFDMSKETLLNLYGRADISLITFSDFPEEMRNNKIVLDNIMSIYRYRSLPLLEWNKQLNETIKTFSIFLKEPFTDKRNKEINPLKDETLQYLKSKVIYPEDYNRPSINIAKQYVNDKNSLTVPLEPAPPYNIPIEYSEENLIIHNLSTDEDADEIYYISDIHIEHQVYNELLKTFNINKMTSDEFTRIFENNLNMRIDELTCGKSGILLVGGDVSDGIGLFEMFYSRLSKKWSGNIIAVLGNHELWDGNTIFENKNHDYQARSIDEIISDYKNAVKHYRNCELLENELFIKYKNDKCRLISEETIIEASEEDLKNILTDCSLIILGGIGYSGLNNFYNAETGLYRKTMTCIDEDKRRTKKFYNVYKKVKKCAYNKRVIVLTHTPVHNWIEEPCNPNWIYVNGHTHQNTITKDSNGTTIIISDNQIGYTPRNWKLNAFTIDCMWYDPFESYNDGIYTITSDEYKLFNQGRSIVSNGCNYKGTLYVLKRNNIYMFILDSINSLCLMDGGKRKRLENPDIQYYYDRLPEYIQKVLDITEPYHKVMLQLSDEVKRIGGTGTIHGCIVDIGMFTHIYVNPFDGKITPYKAYNMHSREVYNNIEDLITDTQESLLMDRFFSEYDKHNLPLMEKHLMADNHRSELCIIPKLVLGTELYTPSKVVKSIQYVWEKNVIRIWKEEIMSTDLRNAIE